MENAKVLEPAGGKRCSPHAPHTHELVDSEAKAAGGIGEISLPATVPPIETDPLSELMEQKEKRKEITPSLRLSILSFSDFSCLGKKCPERRMLSRLPVPYIDAADGQPVPIDHAQWSNVMETDI